MKSDEEFIAGIYEKANQQKTKMMNEESNHVISMISYPTKSNLTHKVKKMSAYAAGLAACFLCGIGIYMTNNFIEETDNNRRFHNVRSQGGSEASPMMIDSELNNVEHVIDYDSLLQCTVLDVIKEDSNYVLTIMLEDQSKATLVIPEQMMNDQISKNHEIVIETYEPDDAHNYTIVPDSEIYVFDRIENGEKTFVSKTKAVIRESELTQQQRD